MSQLEFFSPARLAFTREVINNHPDIVASLLEAGLDLSESKYTEALAHVAGMLNILLDGAYTQADLDRLADMLYIKLVNKNKTIITL